MLQRRCGALEEFAKPVMKHLAQQQHSCVRRLPTPGGEVL